MCREEHPCLLLWMPLSCPPYLSHFFRHFASLSTYFFFCLLTDLPGFSSNRCNTDKQLRGRKRDQKCAKCLKMSQFYLSFQTIIFFKGILRHGEGEGVRGSGGVQSFGLASHRPVWALQLLWKLSKSCLAQTDVRGVCVSEDVSLWKG